jgi:hypothetical protein
MTALVLAPPSYAAAVELAGSGRLWRKRVLPVGTINYKGREIHFRHDYLADLARAFKANAYDQVPFQLAAGDNKHNNDVCNFGGEITDMTAENDGLWITMQPTERGAAILRENPRLGVSARIVEDYSRSDGQFFSAAIQHVLGTLDPRVPGLGEWEAIEASNEPGMAVIDLSSSQFEGDGDLADLSSLLADLSPQPWELAEVDQVMAELAEAEAAQDAADLAVADALAAIELSQELESDRLADAAEAQQRHAASRSLARRMASAAAREGDYALAARVHLDLAADPRGASVIELANHDAAGFSAVRCGPDDGFGGCGSRYHTAGCVHNGVREADESGALPGGLTGAGTVLRDRIESQSGVRMRPRESAFGPAPLAQELPRANPFPAHVRARAAQIAAAAGMPITSPDAARQRAIDRVANTIADVTLRGGGRARGLGDGPTFAERREALRRPVSLQRVDPPAEPPRCPAQLYGWPVIAWAPSAGKPAGTCGGTTCSIPAHPLRTARSAMR